MRKSDQLSAAQALCRHWPEYLMELGESALYLFSASTIATLLWHPASPLRSYLPSDMVRRGFMGAAMGASIVGIVSKPWGKQSGGHLNPAVTLSFDRLGKVTFWDTVFYCFAQLLGAVAGVGLAWAILDGAPGNNVVHYAATMPGVCGTGVAFRAELVISYGFMTAILYASNHVILSRYTHHFAAVLVAIYIAFESPLSGMSANPARTFGPAFWASYWHALWIYFLAPTLGMLSAAEAFLLARSGKPPFCAKLHHYNNKRCIFLHSAQPSTAPQSRERYA